MTNGAREKIVKAAVQLFSEEGYKGATTKKIAAAAGVNESTIFRIFENKDNLFREILSSSSSMMAIINVIRDGDLDNDVRSLLKTVADLYGNLYRDHPSVLRIFLRCAIDREEMEYLENSMGPGAFQYLSDLFSRLEESGSISLKMRPDMTAFYFLSLVHGAYQRAMMFREIDSEIETDGLVSLFLNGVMEQYKHGE